MPKYNYFDIRENLKKDRDYKLPIDINEPIRDYFGKISASIVGKWIDKVELSALCSKIEFVFKKQPLVKYVIKCDYGMIEGFDKVSTIENDNEIGIEYTHIKNKNLNKRKLYAEQ